MATSSPTTSAPWEAKRKQSKLGLLRRLLTWGVALGLLALVASGLRARPIEVEVGKVERGPLTLRTIEEGRTRVRHRYSIAAPLAGQLQRVTLKVGDAVTAGDSVLARINPQLPALLDPRGKAQAEAQVLIAGAGLKRAEETLAIAVTAEKFAKMSWARITKLKDLRSVSETDRDNTQREAEMKAREVKAAEFALKVASFEVEQAKAALLQWDAPAGPSLGSVLEIKAPISGVVLKVQQESATVVSAGAAIMEIGDPTDMEIEAEILSRDAVAIPPGAEVVVDQWGGAEPLQARVRRVEPTAFTKISALGVEEQRVLVLSDLVDAPASAMKLLGDRYRVEVRIATWHHDDVLLVPAGALFREGMVWKTYVLDDGHARQVKLQIGRTDGRVAEVLDGLAVGDEVLLHPPDTVKDGVTVRKREER
jgi:HlyD family secretion protein